MPVWQEVLLLSSISQGSEMILKWQVAMAGITEGVRETFSAVYTSEVVAKA